MLYMSSGKRNAEDHFYEQMEDQEEEEDEDFKPVFVETEESKKLTKEEQKKGLKLIYGGQTKNFGEDNNEQKSGKWIGVEDQISKKLKVDSPKISDNVKSS